MIKYNWDKIINKTKSDPTSIMVVIHLLTYNIVPTNTKDPTYKYYGKDFDGDSFLLNPRQLLAERKNYSNEECAIYVSAASFRNYFEYKKTGNTTLPLIHFPASHNIITNNRLLWIKDEVVHFKFEGNRKKQQNGNKI
jgi:hypothetical protein